MKTFRDKRMLVRAVVAGTVVAVAWFGAMMVYYSIKFPDPLSLQSNQAPVMRVLARDGSLLAERGSKNAYIPIDLLPKHLVEAVVAIEDRRFYDHAGIDVFGLLRAAFANLRAGRYAQGGSTITQQLAKNMYLSSERTIMRKFEELSLALWLEMRLEKSDILELYLNTVYFGSGAYGVEAASQRHFGKSARALSVVEAAIVAGLLKAPSRYSPSSNPAAARKRGRVVLRAMVEAGFLNEAELQVALSRPVRFARSASSTVANGIEYALDYVFDRMPKPLADSRDALIVETSIDLPLQKLAQRTLSETLASQGYKQKAGQGAIVVLDDAGGILAIAGGADYARSSFNRAVKAVRQPGSTFKPFVYLTALEGGMTPETMISDSPVSVEGWSPRNYSGSYRGDVSLREALARSINTVAVRLALQFTPSKVADVARRAGIHAKLREDPSLALGTSEVSLLELTGAYGVFASGGRRVDPHIIRRIKSASGRILYADASGGSKQVAELRDVGAINDMLNAALIAGTGRKAALDRHPAAGKTGTSQGFRDAWFVGYTAHMTAGVWLGNDDGSPMNHVVGGSLPAKIWHQVMADAHRSLEPLPLPGTSRPGTRLGEGRKPFVARFEGKAGRTKTKARFESKTKTTSRSKTAKRGKKLRPTLALIPRRMKVEPPKKPAQLPPHVPAENASASVLTSRSSSHPQQAISEDFIARALDGVPAEQPSQAPIVSDANGFDADAIRRRLQSVEGRQAKARRSRQTGPSFMALGAGSQSKP